MNITIQKRYCFKQSKSWAGGIGTLLSDLASMQAKNPDVDYSIEYNERSTSTKYRLVRVAQVEVELPERPTEEEYQVPKRPKAAKLAEVDVTEEIVTNGPSRKLLRMTHVPTGLQAERATWYPNVSPWERGIVRDQLAERVDPTYKRAFEHWRERHAAFSEAVREWEFACERIVKEAQAEE